MSWNSFVTELAHTRRATHVTVTRVVDGKEEVRDGIDAVVFRSGAFFAAEVDIQESDTVRGADKAGTFEHRVAKSVTNRWGPAELHHTQVTWDTPSLGSRA